MAPGDVRRAGVAGSVIATWFLSLWILIPNAVYVARDYLGWDAHAYWLTAHHDQLYGKAPGQPGAFLYSPVFAQVVHPVAAALPSDVFEIAWVVAEAAAFGWLLWRCPWKWALPLAAVAANEVALGNIVGFLTVAWVLSSTRPGLWARGLWALAYLTKPPLAAVALLDRLGRRDVRGALAPVLVAAALAAVSVVFTPGLWSSWWRVLTSSNPQSLFVAAHVLPGLLLAAVGGRRGWWWAGPVALVLATPFMAGPQPLAYLCALPRLARAASSSPREPEAVRGDALSARSSRRSRERPGTR